MSAIPRDEYPRPQLARKRRVSLNGPWQFEFDPGASGFERGWQSGKKFSREAKFDRHLIETINRRKAAIEP